MVLKHWRLLALFIFAIAAVFTSCNNAQKNKKKLSEGMVIYNISYPPRLKSHSMSFLFPKEMKLLFKNEKQRASFKGNMDLYSLDFIHSNQSDSFFTLLQVLEKKIYVPSAKSDDIFLFNNYSNEEVVFSRDVNKKIAGYICEKASLKSRRDETNSVTIWFTNEIGVDNPNRNTPFEKIPGVMLEFEIYYENILFHFLAEKVVTEKISEDLFFIPENYSPSSIKEVESLINSVLR